MIKEILNFRHDSDSIPTAMGLDKEIDDKCREIVHFSAFTSFFIKEDFFGDDENNTPENLTTVTGILEKALGLCKTKEEEVYTLFVFKSVHNHCSQALAAYQVFEEEKDEKNRKKMKMLMELAELKAMVDDEDDRKDMVTPKDMFRKIEAAKDNMYNFENYYKALKNESSS